MASSPASTAAAAQRVAAQVSGNQQNPSGSFTTALNQYRRQTQAVSPEPDPFTEIGTSGLRQYGGFVLEEWLAQLQGRKAAWVYREMMDNSAIIGAILFAVEWMARRVTWSVENDQDEFIEQCMHDMEQPWGDFITDALSFIPYGYSFHEIVLGRRQGRQKRLPAVDDPTAATQENTELPWSSQYKDGKIGWRRLPVRAQETLLRWEFAGYSTVTAFVQIDWHGGHHVIPTSKGLLFRSRPRRNNPEGYSCLRTSVVPYTRQKVIEQLEAIGVERDLAGIPKMTPPEGVDLFAPANSQLYAQVQRMVTSIRRDEFEGVVLPTSGWEFELVSAAGSRQIDTDAVVRRYEVQIATAMLADFMKLGQNSVGSFALADVKTDLFATALDGMMDLICEVLNQQGVIPLLEVNGMSIDDPPPTITHSSVTQMDLDKIGSFLWQIQGAGAPIPWSKSLLERLFDEAGLPTNFDEAVKEPVPQVEEDEPEQPVGPAMLPPGQDPWAREAHYEQPDGQQPAAGRQAPNPAQIATLAKAEHTGAMVALYPPSEIATQLACRNGLAAEDLHLTLAFLGDAGRVSSPDQLKALVAGFAATCPPLSGQINGGGIFKVPETVAYANPDLPGLADMRHHLVGMLERGGFVVSVEHGFTPHITLACGPHAGATNLPNGPIPVTFSTISVVLAGQRTDYALTGKPIAVRKADEKPRTQDLPEGTVHRIAPKLRDRQTFLANQLEHEVDRALAELGEHAARAYMGIVQKAEPPRTRKDGQPHLQSLVAAVMRALGLRRWFEDRLQPLFKNHGSRVIADTQRTIQSEIGLQVGVPPDEAERIIDLAGTTGLGLRDIEPQVGQAILMAVKAGQQAGEHPAQIATRIKQQVPAGRFVNAGPAYRSRLIARTETAHIQLESTKAAYKSNPRIGHVEISDGVLADSDADCQARDGDVVPIDDADDIEQLHPQCTLSLSPIVAPPVVTPNLPEPELITV